MNFNDASGLMIAVVENGFIFSTTVYARPLSGDFPIAVLKAVLQRDTPRNVGIALRQFDIWGDMFDVAANALGQYGGSSANRLRGGDISEDCTKEILVLGITPDAWADTLDDLYMQSGLGSKDPFYTALPVGSTGRALAQPGSNECAALIASFRVSTDVYQGHAPDPTDGATFYVHYWYLSPPWGGSQPNLANPFGFNADPFVTYITPFTPYTISGATYYVSAWFYKPADPWFYAGN